MPSPLNSWLPLPWPPEFFVPSCFCCGGSANAYSCGGVDAFNTAFYATTDRTVFATDVTSSVAAANLTTNRGEAAGVSNPDVAGYMAGGKTSGNVVVVTADKLIFATETTGTATAADLSTGRHALGGLSERDSKAYFAGGFSTPITSIADKLTFATNSTNANTSADLSTARGGLCGMSQGTTKGFWGGGFTGSLSRTTRTDKITFASDTTASQTTADLSTGRDRYQSMSDGSSKGYFAGGQTGIGFSICDKLTFATDSSASQTSAAINRYGGAGMANGVIGYALGGIDAAGVSKSGNKFTFATDSVATLGIGSNLSTQRTGIAGLSTVGL